MKSNPTDIADKIKELLKEKSYNYKSILKYANQLSKFDPKFQRFSIDAKTLIHLGRDSIKDHTTALIELVKNSYDADATNVDVEVFTKNGNDLIRVADNGFGMTKEQLLNNWLRIGFSEKKKAKLSELKRRKTGEKGIGRISTDRLGAKLELKTKTEGDGIIGLRINWDEFEQEGYEVYDIDVEITTPETINVPNKNGQESKTGTEIIIKELRQAWTQNNIQNLYYELSALTPPYNEVTDFSVNLENDITIAYSKKVDSSFFKAAEIELNAIYDGKGSEIFYSIRDKYNNDEVTETIKWQQLLPDLPKRDLHVDHQEDLTLGPITIKLLFFLREAASVLGTELKLSDLRSFLDNNAGIKIYRDNFAVRPYGFPDAQFGADWLELGDRKARNPAGIGRGEEYMVNPNQLVGAVFITRDNNSKLTDSASREGLVANEAFDELATLVKSSILMLESHRAKIYPQLEKTRKAKDKTSPQKEAENIRVQLNLVKEDLKAVVKDVEKKGDDYKPTEIIKPIEKTISKVELIKEDVGDTLSELLNWQRVLSGLATVGISSAVFGHEIEDPITQIKASSATAKLVLEARPPKIEDALKELEKVLKSSKKVAAWGAYALTRVQREKRNKRVVQIKETISNVLKELKPAFDASSIEIQFDGEKIYSRTFQMDLESMLVNLLTNAYTASLLKAGKRLIKIKLEMRDKGNKDGYVLSVSDSGPGVAKEFEHRIFEPLFSTKVKAIKKSKSVGTGLGLTIVKSIAEDLQGEVTFDRDPILKGARFNIWLPKEE